MLHSCGDGECHIRSGHIFHNLVGRRCRRAFVGGTEMLRLRFGDFIELFVAHHAPEYRQLQMNRSIPCKCEVEILAQLA